MAKPESLGKLPFLAKPESMVLRCSSRWLVAAAPNHLALFDSKLAEGKRGWVDHSARLQKTLGEDARRVRDVAIHRDEMSGIPTLTLATDRALWRLRDDVAFRFSPDAGSAWTIANLIDGVPASESVFSQVSPNPSHGLQIGHLNWASLLGGAASASVSGSATARLFALRDGTVVLFDPSESRITRLSDHASTSVPVPGATLASADGHGKHVYVGGPSGLFQINWDCKTAAAIDQSPVANVLLGLDHWILAGDTSGLVRALEQTRPRDRDHDQKSTSSWRALLGENVLLHTIQLQVVRDKGGETYGRAVFLARSQRPRTVPKPGADSFLEAFTLDVRHLSRASRKRRLLQSRRLHEQERQQIKQARLQHERENGAFAQDQDEDEGYHFSCM